MTIESSVGTILYLDVIGNNRIYSSTAGGLFLSNSDIKANGLYIQKNKAQNGSGFYCSGGSLNLIFGLIDRNIATEGAAVECTNNCSFIFDQTTITNNTQTRPSSCRGVPTK